MSRPTSPIIYGLVEGITDEAVLARLIRHVGGNPGSVYGKMGKPYLLEHIEHYNEFARRMPLVVLVDLNRKYPCAPELRAAWLPRPSANMCFRIAVREIEAWLMADRERLASFLCVPVSKVPTHPDGEQDPKHELVELARRSRRRDIHQDMVPRPGSGRKTGPAYASRLIEFASNEKAGWRPEVAAGSSESLRRCLTRLRELVATV